MRLARALLVLVALAAAPVSAETIGLRAGEHAGFSRLVLDGAAGLDWTIGRTDTGYALRAPAGVDGYDLGRTDRDLSAGRVTALRPEGDALYIDLGCTCRMKSFALSGGRLVLDISAGAADPASPLETAFQPARPDSEVAPETADMADAGPDDPAAVFPVISGVPGLADRIIGGVPEPSDATMAGDVPDTDTQSAPSYDDFEAMLVESLGRAAAEGFVTASGDFVADPSAPGGPGQAAGAEARTAYDIAKGEPGIATPVDVCEAVHALDFLADDARFNGVEIGPLIRDAYREDGALSEDDALMLARYLMWTGYGAEAAQVIELAGLESDAAMVMATAARAIDGQAASGDVALGDIALCTGTGGLWAMLAGADGDLTDRIDRAAAIRTYTEYRAHLRRIVGPLLATHLMTYGYLDDARLVANALPGPDAGELEDEAGAEAVQTLAEITLNLASDTQSPDAALEGLDNHIATGSPETHEAVLLRSRALSAAGTPPTGDEIETLVALQTDAGSGPLGHDLFVTEIRRRLDGSHFADALARLEDPPRAIPANEIAGLEVEAWSGLIALGANFDLALAMRRWPDRAAVVDIAPGMRARLSERLNEIKGADLTEPAEATGETASAALPPLVLPRDLLADPKPVAAARATLDAMQSERAALEALLAGTPAAE